MDNLNMKYFKNIIFFFLISLSHTDEIIVFESSNPFSLKDIILDIEKLDTQKVKGLLQIPESDDKNKFPLVIGVAGSIGWGEHHLEYLKMYREMGIATFQLQSFESRNEISTVGTQNTVTTPMIILDSYRALEKLSEHPKIDIDNVAITGWSLGGGVALFSGWKPVMDAINSKFKFAAHLSYYPPCFAEPEIVEFTDSPMHILIGELDEWVPAQACYDLVNLMKDNKINIDIDVYKDAHHSFDRKTELKVAENGYKFTDCRFKLRDDGAVLMNFLNIPMTNPFLQKIGFAMCAERNPLFGGHKESRRKSFEFSKDFMKNNLMD
tara:strand:+ start:4613 stop:5581 length:969 start_codon:yes stop_codon:yes gene_type:complete